MASWVGAGRPLAFPGCPTLQFSSYPIARIALPRGPGAPRTWSPSDFGAAEIPLGAPAPAARPLSTPTAAAAPRSLELLLAAEVPVALDALWDDLIDHRAGLLVALHRSLGSQDFSAAAPPVSAAAAAETLAAVDLVLTFATPLPLAGLVARNTEALAARRTRRGAFSVASVCASRGVPMTGSFVNKLLWEARESSATTTSLRISGARWPTMRFGALTRGRSRQSHVNHFLSFLQRAPSSRPPCWA